VCKKFITNKHLKKIKKLKKLFIAEKFLAIGPEFAT